MTESAADRESVLDVCRAILRAIEQRFDQGLVPCRPLFVDVTELPGEEYRGLWRVIVWGKDHAGIAADVDVGAKTEIEALARALAAFVTRTRDEWVAEMPVEL